MHSFDALSFCYQSLHIVGSDQDGRFLHSDILDYRVDPAVLGLLYVVEIWPLSYKFYRDTSRRGALSHFLYLFKPYKAMLLVGRRLRLELVKHRQGDDDFASLFDLACFEHLCNFAVNDYTGVKYEFPIVQVLISSATVI